MQLSLMVATRVSMVVRQKMTSMSVKSFSLTRRFSTIWMGSDELSYNDFRATLTKQKLEREQPSRKAQANGAHHEMGKAVRKTIIEAGAILPEHLPTPEKSIQQLEKERKSDIEKFLQRRERP
jgi:hypothetical protein